MLFANKVAYYTILKVIYNLVSCTFLCNFEGANPPPQSRWALFNMRFVVFFHWNSTGFKLGSDTGIHLNLTSLPSSFSSKPLPQFLLELHPIHLS